MKRRDLRRTFKLIPYERAWSQLMEATRIGSLGHEEVRLENAIDRVLAEDIVSEVNIPEANRAVSDGYAVQAEDTKDASSTKPIKLKIAGETFPSEAPHEVTSGQAVYVACGATVPRGADAVVKVENTLLLEDRIEIRFPLKTGENMALAGEDVRDGSLIFKRGHVLRPQDVGLLAGVGRTWRLQRVNYNNRL